MLALSNIDSIVSNFPKSKIYSLTTQLRRNTISNPSNISDAYNRKGNKYYLKFLKIPISSLFEMQTQIKIAYNFKYID